MFGKFFGTTEVDAYADWVLSEVRRSLPPAGFERGPKALKERTDQLSARLGSRTGEFKRDVKLNVYKLARLTARVKDGLKTAGYPDRFVDSFAADLLARLRAPPKQRPAG